MVGKIVIQTNEIARDGAKEFLGTASVWDIPIKDKTRSQQSVVVAMLCNSVCDGAFASARDITQPKYLGWC